MKQIFLLLFLLSPLVVISKENSSPKMYWYACELIMYNNFLKQPSDIYTEVQKSLSKGEVPNIRMLSGVEPNWNDRNNWNGQNNQSQDVLWQNHDGTVNMKAGSTGNPILDCLPAPARSVIIAVKFLKNIKSEFINFKKIFGIYPKIPLNICHEMIEHDPYLNKVYHRINSFEDCLALSNDNNLPNRVLARIQLIEAELPPPYDKKLKKCIKKLKQKCTDPHGTINNLDILPIRQIFQPFKNENFSQANQFVAKIPKLKKQSGYRPKEKMSSATHEEIVNLILNEPKISYRQLMQSCQFHNNKIIKQLYNFYNEQRFSKDYAQISQDPYCKSNQKNLSPEIVSKLLQRAELKKEIENWICNEPLPETIAKNVIFSEIDSINNDEYLHKTYGHKVLTSLLENNCLGIDNCPLDRLNTLFNSSGVFKKYNNDPYVQLHFANKKLNSPELHKAINYALIVNDQTRLPAVEYACGEILYNAKLALDSPDPDFALLFEQNAYELYQQLLENQENFTFSQTMNFEHIKECEQLKIDNNHNEISRVAAYNQTKKNNYHVYEKYYKLPSRVKGFMLAQGINASAFTRVEGNDFQHHLTQELVTILNHDNYQFDEFLTTFATYTGLAQNYNLTKDYHRSMVIIDFCWSGLRYAEAVALGLCDTAIGAIDFARHPIKNIVEMAQGLKKIALGIGKGVFDLGKYATALEYGFHKEAQEIREYYSQVWKSLKQAAQKLSKTTGPERVRKVTNIISDQLLMRQAIGDLGNIIGKLSNSLKKHPSMRAYEMLEGLARKDKTVTEAVLAEGFYCVDEAKKITTKIDSASRLTNPHLHLVNQPNELCKIPTAYLVYIKKFSEVAKSEKKFPSTTRMLQIMSTPKHTPFLQSIINQSKETIYPKIKRTRLIKEAVAKNPIKAEGLSKTSDMINATIEKNKLRSIELVRATERLNSAIPSCHDCMEKALAISKAGPVKMKYQFSSIQSGELLAPTIVDMELRIRHYTIPGIAFQNNNVNKPKLHHIHLDCGGRIAKKGEITFVRKAERQGAYLADFYAFGNKGVEKTFWPINWNPDIIKQKIIEAMNNIKTKELDNLKAASINKINTYIVIGETKCGMKIRLAIREQIENSKIVIVSACPDGNWILQV